MDFNKALDIVSHDIPEEKLLRLWVAQADSDVHWKTAERPGQTMGNPPTPLVSSFLW